jgi:hypothetical protein
LFTYRKYDFYLANILLMYYVEIEFYFYYFNPCIIKINLEITIIVKLLTAETFDRG